MTQRNWVTIKEYEDIRFEFFEGIAKITIDRQQVYNALFDITDGVVTRLTEDRAISVGELDEALKKIEKTKILVFVQDFGCTFGIYLV